MAKRFYCFLSFFSFFCSGYAQEFQTRQFNEERGLLQKFIFSIAQDRNGVLFLGTENGLTSYNGDQFQSWTTSHGLAEDQVSCVFADSRNKIWIGHFQKGISVFDGNHITIIDTLATGRINSFAEDKSGNIWGTSAGKGIFRINGISGKLEFPAGGSVNASQITFDAEGQLIAGREDGVGIYHLEKDGSILLFAILPELHGKKVNALCLRNLKGKEILAVAVDEEGVFIFRHEQMQYRLITQMTTGLGYSYPIFSAIDFDLDGNLWLGTIGQGLRKITFDEKFRPKHVDICYGIGDDNVKSLLIDTENNTWIGTFGNSLLEIPYSAFRYYTKSNALLRAEVNCIAKGDLGNFWLGNNQGLTRYRPNDPGNTRIFDERDGFTSKRVTCMQRDAEGYIWIGTYGDGIFLLNPENGKFENMSEKHHLQSLNINTITASRSRKIYIGTTDGLYIYDQHWGKFSYLTTLDGLMHNNIQHLYADQQDNIWFSSAGTPPYYLKDLEITLFNQVDKLRGYNLNSICGDNSGMYWIATDGDGVFSFDGKQFRQFTVKNGLRSSSAIAITSDDQGQIWVVHKSGVSLLFPGDSVFYNFSAADNKLFNDMNPSVYKDVSGVLYLCSAGGLIEILPLDKSYLRREARLSLAHLFINGIELPRTKEVILDPGTYNLSFEFNNILYGAAVRPAFFYRIVGADSTWRPASGRNVNIPQLSSGEYILEASTLKNPAMAPASFSVRISIDKPFWQKAWFLWTTVLSVPLVVIGLIRLQTVSLRRLNRKLHGLVRQKTLLLVEEKEAVSRINLQLEDKNRDIMDSIRYAKRIQLAALPDMALLKTYFPHSFIFYQPRDIVSGDFYWFAEKDDIFIIAAVDCTGHGIPGAFMSMIGTTLLNKIIFDDDTGSPAIILARLNKEVTSSLHQQEAYDSSHDGMDIALCIIDRKTNSLRFSGAGRPFCLVRNDEVQVIKSNKAGIGGRYGHDTIEYDETIVQLEEGDSFYLFSDGYADQFSSETGGKFSSRRLRELFRSISGLPATDQEKKVRETFYEWKGEEFQYDDILVIGIRYDLQETQVPGTFAENIKEL